MISIGLVVLISALGVFAYRALDNPANYVETPAAPILVEVAGEVFKEQSGKNATNLLPVTLDTGERVNLEVPSPGSPASEGSILTAWRAPVPLTQVWTPDLLTASNPIGLDETTEHSYALNEFLTIKRLGLSDLQVLLMISFISLLSGVASWLRAKALKMEQDRMRNPKALYFHSACVWVPGFLMVVYLMYASLNEGVATEGLIFSIASLSVMVGITSVTLISMPIMLADKYLRKPKT